VTQIKRSAGQSAVAAAAYRVGEKLHSVYYGEDSDYTRKGGVICSEILLPLHAPPEYADRETLWNAVEKAERGKKAQLAYSFDIALQNEFSMQENIDLARQFLSDNFVSRGMVADFAVHQPDKENGGISNPHFHVMCPIRPIEPDGRWGKKQRREYVLDEHGERVLDEAGNYVFNAVPTTDWGKPETLEAWRQAWADLCNAKFAEKGLDCRIDHRSFARQGVEQIPTQHEGPTVRAMEAKGIRTDKGNLNRFIRKTNALLREAKEKITALIGWLKDVKAELAKPQPPMLNDLLALHCSIRNKSAYRKLQGHWIIEMSEMIATANAKSIEEIKSFLSRQKEVYKIPYETHPADRLRQCVFGGTSNAMDFLPLDRSGNRRFLPVQVCPEQAEVHILEDEAASRAYLQQVWAEAMTIYRTGDWKLTFSPEMVRYLKAHQKDFMPEDTKAGMIQAFLDSYTGDTVCSKQLYKEALNHIFDEPKQWEIREINEIMNQCVTGWTYFSNPRSFAGYGRQKGWERERATTGSGNSAAKIPDGFVEITEQIEMPF
jgi:hypothetical protein